MSPRLKRQWRPSLFKLMLMIVIASLMLHQKHIVESAKRSHQAQNEPASNQRIPFDADPMEPCYLANNRASESLTISESTPVGTVVGEILVNGDSSANGNIELSIKMPSGGQQSDQATVARQFSPTNQQQPDGSSASSSVSRRGGIIDKRPVAKAMGKSARDLSNLIDLMPPLSIEQDTKRLILAKKLDRENLDRYITAGGYQSSSLGGSLSQSSSSASLTVHIKCQLKEPKQSTNLNLPLIQNTNNSSSIGPTSVNDNNNSSNIATTDSKSNDTKKISKLNSHSNSILIPIHLIVTDENDNWPMFINSPYIIDLNETIQVGALLPGNEIVAIDNDQQGPLSTIEYSIVAGSLWSDSFAFLNPLDSRSLIIKDNSLLDYEAQSKLSLKVMARDQGEPPNWAITSLYINLFDNDDLNPIFSEDRYYGYVKDNQPGEVIDLLPKRLTARDGDKTISAPIVYSFHTKTNHSIHFDLDPDLGKLSLKKSLLAESSKQNFGFCLLVRASQLDNPQRWSLTMINMRVSRNPVSQLDPTATRLEQLLTINTEHQHQQVEPSSQQQQQQQQQQHVFKFPQSNYTIEISESAPPGFTVLNVKASFGQTSGGESGLVTYHLLENEAGYLQLDHRSGRLTLNKSLDYELYRQLSVRILATYEYHDDAPLRKSINPSTSQSAPSGNFPKLLCDMIRVNINVLNQNDHKPEFSHEQYHFQLFVSDLIANFEPPQIKETTEAPGKQTKWAANLADQQVRAGRMLGEAAKSSLVKRFGEFEFEEPNEDPLDWRAMQLGQVYCADRDYGDKLTLKLTGSKVNLFHLTQDGRLYLPLINLTSHYQSTGSIGSVNNRMDHNIHPAASRIINNQFIQSKLFSSRRSDLQDALPDRDYLNYLLGEVSNLGRLRLKVTASDNGLPEAHQTTAIIVITIISIDNFILQRAPQLPRGLNESLTNDAIQLSNDTSYYTASNRASDQFGEQEGKSQQQVMMIPAANGRSFVQINPDIIGNLISNQNGYNNDANSSSFNGVGPAKQVQASMSTNAPTNGGRAAGLQLPAAAAAYPGSSTSGAPESASIQNGSRFRPPSLLLVDDDGAKFVAMPVAMEVYERQVQEAADLQQARQRIHVNEMDPVKRIGTGVDTNGKTTLDNSNQSFWSSLWRFKSKEQQQQTSSGSQPTTGGIMHWINVSTAIMLHLLALAVIITLLSKLRSSLINQNGSHSLVGGLWPARFNGAPSFMQSPKSRAKRSMSNMLEQAAINNGDTFSGRACLSSSDSSEGGSGYSFLSARQQHHRNSKALPNGQYMTRNNGSDSSHCGSSTDSAANSTNQGQVNRQAVSSGIIVSAMSNGYKLRPAPLSSPSIGNQAGGQMDNHNTTEALEIAKQTNLFGHLKMTLNRMLDSSNDESKHIGQVTIKALDSDRLPFVEHHQTVSSNNATELDCNKLLDGKPAQSGMKIPETIVEVRSAGESGVKVRQSEKKQQPCDSLGVNYTKSSTFVGGQRALSPNNQQQVDKQASTSEEATTIVSINVVPTESEPANVSKKPAIRRPAEVTNSSSSSSVVSLVSMSSSIISNKIKAAVERTSSDNITGSDVSSLDSTTLFNGLPPAGSRSRRLVDHCANGPPAPPPPPPPPPSLVHVRVESPSTSLISGNRQLDSKPFSARPIEGSVQSSPVSGTRRPLPQNPLHVKLKQQAAAISAENNSISTGSKKRDQLNRSAEGSFKRQVEAQTNSKATRDASAQIKVKRTFPGSPPTPPPLPSNLQPGNMKTVSPTTSVDRGYESLQSYTSSSQHQRLQATGCSGGGGLPQTSYDLNHHDTASSPSSRQPNAPAGSSGAGTSKRTFVASNMQQSPVIGRQSQRPGQSATQVSRGSPRQVYKTMIEGTNSTATNEGPSNQAASSTQRVKPRASQDRLTAAPNVSGRRPRGNSVKNAQEAPTTSGHHHRQTRLASSVRSVQTRTRPQLNQALLVRGQQSVDCDETEDDDFYYCYSHSPQKNQPNHQVEANSLLSDYASHTYNDRGSSNSRSHQKELVLPGQDYFTAKQSPRKNFIVDQGSMIELARSIAVPSSTNEMQILLNNGADLRLNPTAAMMYHLADTVDTAGEQQLIGHKNHHHHHSHVNNGHYQEQQSFSQHQQPQQRQNLRNSFTNNQPNATGVGGGGAGGNKKVLTWSDQVGLA